MPEYLETTADKFTFRVATDRLYSPEGVWILPEPDAKRVRVGLADYLQQHNGDVALRSKKLVAQPQAFTRFKSAWASSQQLTGSTAETS